MELERVVEIVEMESEIGPREEAEVLAEKILQSVESQRHTVPSKLSETEVETSTTTVKVGSSDMEDTPRSTAQIMTEEIEDASRSVEQSMAGEEVLTSSKIADDEAEAKAEGGASDSGGSDFNFSETGEVMKFRRSVSTASSAYLDVNGLPSIDKFEVIRKESFTETLTFSYESEQKDLKSKSKLKSNLNSHSAENAAVGNETEPEAESESETKTDEVSISYSFIATVTSETEKLRDDFVYFFGCTEILAPRLNSNGEITHVLQDISCLANKYILLYISSNDHPKEVYKQTDLRTTLNQFISTENQIESPAEMRDLEREEGTNQADFVVLYVSCDMSEAGFKQALSNQPFHAIPFDKDSTRTTLLEQFGYFNNKTAKIIVMNPKQAVLTSWGKSCLWYNRENCVSEWKLNKPGISAAQLYWTKYISG